MPDTQYKEVLIVLIVCLVLFLLLAAIILLFLYLYQRRRRQQQLQMQELQQQFKEQSLKAQLEIQEHTFEAISQEIHDNVGQVLSLAKVQINIIHESQHMDKGLLMGIKENIGKAMADLRDLSRSLNSERVCDCSIHETLLQETERINRTGILQAAFRVEGDTREMPPQKKLIVFRIVQESIQNCIKHAEASQVSILCRYRSEDVQISVSDNGKGFDPQSIPQTGGGQGLANIRTRVRLAGGTHSVDSIPLQGTQINLSIPYE